MFCILTGIVIAPADCEKAILVPQIVLLSLYLHWRSDEVNEAWY
jgi:hypothetical protein